MGFVSGTAVTVNSDFIKYFAETEMDHLERDGVDWETTTHVGVIDEHIAYLRSQRGVADPSTIANVTDHKPLLTAMVLEKIFWTAGDGEKQERYAQKVKDLRETIAITYADGDIDAPNRGLPRLVQADVGGPNYLGRTSRTSQIGASITGFSNFVDEGG